MSDSKERLDYQGRIHRIWTLNNKYEMHDRPPGVRVLFDDGKHILLTSEYRFELKDRDWRLPGGKVADTYEGWQNLHENSNISHELGVAAIREAREEVGLEPSEVRLLYTTKPGATTDWTLHYFAAMGGYEEVEKGGEEDEDIEVHWVPKEEVLKMAKMGEIQEERTALFLIRYLEGTLELP